MQKYRNKETGEIVKGELKYIPYPDTGPCDILLNHYYYEFYLSCFKKILYKNEESFKIEYEELNNNKE